MEYREILNALEAENRLRRIPDGIEADRIDLLSNDYMGLAAEAELYREEFLDRFSDAPMTSAASRLLSRRQRHHNMLEEMLSGLYGRPALLFNSGYHANTGVLQALGVAGTLFIADKLVHASAIDGLRLSGREFKRFPHNNMVALARLIEENVDSYERIVIVVESVYSMDGDIAPLQEIVALKNRFDNVIICLDEAHGFGVRGARGLGLAEETSLLQDIDVIIGTLGKAAASTGAFAVASPEIISLFINTARSFIFSTALPPACCAWSMLMIEKLTAMKARRLHLAKLSANFAEKLSATLGVESPSRSQIVPLIVGDASRAVKLAGICADAGFDCMAIRRPTVPPHGERLRFSLNALLTDEMLRPLLELLLTHWK